MRIKTNGSIYVAVLAGALLAFGSLAAQDAPAKSEPACKQCRTDFKSCKDKAKADNPGKDGAAARREAIKACHETMMACIAPCKECKSMCRAEKQAGKEQCKKDFDPKECPDGDKECKNVLKDERKSCMDNIKSTDCNDRCKVQ